jgi:hypothetical protein
MDDTGHAKAQPPVTPLKEAVRSARIEAAERSAVVVELRDAEAARLEMLNEAIAPVFSDIPAEHLDLFDRGLSAGSTPKLWIDMVAHVAMGRDKRTYRLLQDTIHGRRVIAESSEIEPMVTAVTRYVARRLVAREQMLIGMASEEAAPKRRRGRVAFAFILGLAAGAVALFAFGYFITR